MKVCRCFFLVLVSCLNANAQLFSDSFDTGLGAWTASGTWAINAGNAATDSPSNNYTNDIPTQR